MKDFTPDYQGERVAMAHQHRDRSAGRPVKRSALLLGQDDDFQRPGIYLSGKDTVDQDEELGVEIKIFRVFRKNISGGKSTD